MTVQRLLVTLTKLAAEPTKYDNKTSRWAAWVNGHWLMDCCRSIKAVLWGFSFDKEAAHGGAVYKRGYPDYTCEEMIANCDDVSTTICKEVIKPGELLYFGRKVAGKISGHVGIYIGNGNVFECAPSVAGCAITDLSYQPWQKHGKIREIEYGDAPAPAPVPKEPELKKGEELFLRNEPLYASSSRKEASCCINGEVFLTDGKLVRGRVRVCKTKDDVGKIDKVLGWIDWRWKV